MNAMPMSSRTSFATLRRAACALAAGALTLSAHALDADAVLARVSNSVWLIKTLDPQGEPLAYGSAVVIGAGRVATNCHVLRQAAAVTLHQSDKALPARLAFADPERDLCLLDAPGLVAPAAETTPTHNLAVGQKVFAVGWPGGQERRLTPGIVLGVQRRLDGAAEYIRTSAPAAEGSSGGGLFNEEGQLIGITSAALRNATFSILFARPADWLDQVPRRGAAALAAYRQQHPTASAAPATGQR